MNCPNCGKLMEEQAQFKGLWMCPDYIHATNERPPFQYKCKGMKLTEQGASDLERELNKQWLNNAIKNN